jgi:hypothetical protein
MQWLHRLHHLRYHLLALTLLRSRLTVNSYPEPPLLLIAAPTPVLWIEPAFPLSLCKRPWLHYLLSASAWLDLWALVLHTVPRFFQLPLESLRKPCKLLVRSWHCVHNHQLLFQRCHFQPCLSRNTAHHCLIPMTVMGNLLLPLFLLSVGAHARPILFPYPLIQRAGVSISSPKISRLSQLCHWTNRSGQTNPGQSNTCPKSPSPLSVSGSPDLSAWLPCCNLYRFPSIMVTSTGL